MSRTPDFHLRESSCDVSRTLLQTMLESTELSHISFLTLSCITACEENAGEDDVTHFQDTEGVQQAKDARHSP